VPLNLTQINQEAPTENKKLVYPRLKMLRGRAHLKKQADATSSRSVSGTTRLSFSTRCAAAAGASALSQSEKGFVVY